MPLLAARVMPLHTLLDPSIFEVDDITGEDPLVTQAEDVTTMFVATVDRDRAEAALEPYESVTPVGIGEKAFLTATAFQYKSTPFGRYREVVLGIMGTTDPSKQNLRLSHLPAALGMLSTPRDLSREKILEMPEGHLVIVGGELFLTSDPAIKFGREGMALDKHKAEINYHVDGRSRQHVAVFDDSRNLLVSARARSHVRVTPRTGRHFRDPAHWMRFRYVTRLPGQTGPDRVIGVAVRSEMGLDLLPLGSRLEFGGALLQKYGEVDVRALLQFYDMEAAFDFVSRP